MSEANDEMTKHVEKTTGMMNDALIEAARISYEDCVAEYTPKIQALETELKELKTKLRKVKKVLSALNDSEE